MSGLLNWLATLTPLMQVLIAVAAFLAVIGLLVFFIEIAPRPGRFLTAVRLAVCVLVPAVLVVLFGVEASAFWVVIVAALLGALLFWLDFRSRKGTAYLIQLFAFLAPAVVLLLIGLFYPSVKTIVASFFSNDGSKFVGLDNYVWVFSPGGAGFIAFVNTLIWTLIAPAVATAVGLAYAVFVDKSRGEKVLKVFVFMPVAISLVGASIIWKFFYDYRQGDQIGLLNEIVVSFGGQPVSWLQSYPLNVFMLIVILIWSQTGFAMVILSAAIKGVPDDQVEAAMLDGASGWQRFWNVTVPTIRPTIVVVWITISIMSLKVYDIIATTTAGQNNTSVLGYEMVRQFSILPPQTGHSAALAVLILVLVTPFIVYNAHNLKVQREEG